MAASNGSSPFLFALGAILCSLQSMIVAAGASASATSARNAAAGVNVNANPYISGCLYQHNLTSQIRVCNSDDSADIVAAGLCRQPPVPQYHDPEIRLLVQDWETAGFISWVLQFILSELLDAPASVESGTPIVSKMNVYGPHNHEFEVGLVSPQYKVALGNAQRFKDCAKA